MLATELLLSKGYIIRETNWRCGKAEIDIVAEKDMRLVVVEVKTRTSDYVDPTEAIDRKKIYNISQTANHFVKMFRVTERLQYDAIIIHVEKFTNRYKIEHIERAFNPMYL